MNSVAGLRFLVLQVITPHFHRADALELMGETERLVKTLGGDVVGKEIQHRVKPHPGSYIGKGKLEWLVDVVKREKIDVVVMNEVVAAGQLFRVEKALWKVNPNIQVWDRVGLILNIFDKHAKTREAKLQIELARITHEGPRIYGLGKDRLSRQGGGIGTRGLGETNIERERRLIKRKQQQMKKALVKLHGQKHQRIKRRREMGLGPVALVGYTSAGKTSLFNALTGKRKELAAELFTTLDTVVGRMKTSDPRMPVLVSDTIGFIRDLPPVLIDAFASTLAESLEAKLLLHVVDVGDERMLEKIEVVEEILEGLGITQPVVLVWNKIDEVSEARLKQVERVYKERDQVFVSAIKGNGVGDLKRQVVEKLKAEEMNVEIGVG